MKRLIVSAVFLCAVAAFAQDDRKSMKAAAAARAQPMPLAAGGSFFGKTPRLRSWVLGWALTGSKPDAYEIRCDDVFTDCAIPILRTRALSSEPYGMGSLTHSEGAQPWRGARVELKAELRTGRVDGWAGLWMRIDGPDGKVLAFDNMQNRPLRGTSSFQWYSVVLDVPADAERISFGVMLHGPGAVFIRELRFDAADTEVTSTDLVGPLRAQTP
ncbi:MAG: hypothetical protein IT380_14965 [Myxococcales bacterium]|nr:hypothetical protein [Myxococcales bacterium]